MAVTIINNGFPSQEKSEKEEQDDGEGEGLAVHVIAEGLRLFPTTVPAASTAAETHSSDAERNAQQPPNDSHDDESDPPSSKLIKTTGEHIRSNSDRDRSNKHRMKQ